MCDDDKNPMSALEQEIINLMYATFERPFRDTEFEFDNNYTLNQYNRVFNKFNGKANFADYYFADYYYSKILTIAFVESIFESNDYKDLLELLSYFKNVKTVEFSEIKNVKTVEFSENDIILSDMVQNDIILSDMLPFFTLLFEMYPTINNFIFCRNRLLPENPQDSDYENLEECFKLMIKYNLKNLNLSGNLDDDNQSKILGIMTGVFKKSPNLVSVRLDSTNIIEEEDVFKLLKEFVGEEESAIRHVSFEDNTIVLQNPSEFYCKLFELLNATPPLLTDIDIPQPELTRIPFELSSLNFGNPDDYGDEPEYEPEAEVEEIIHTSLKDNCALTEFTSTYPSVDKVVKPYLQRNLEMFWIRQNTPAFSNDFFKVLITFLLANKNGNKPQLPIDICFKIFGFFQNNMFLEEKH